MNKRVVAALLWFYAGWTIGSLVASTLGLSSILGPIVGIATATLFAADLRSVLRGKGDEPRSSSEAQPDSI